MKRQQATKAKRIIMLWIKKKKKEYKKQKLSYPVRVNIQESPNSKGWWGVYIATDGNAYDDLYTNEGYYVGAAEAQEFGIKQGATGGSQDELESYVNKRMGFKRSDHYFEKEGGGVLIYY